MSLEDLPPGSPEWYEALHEKWRKIRIEAQKIQAELKLLKERLEEINARFIMRSLRHDPKKREEYINKLYDPFYEPTRVEELVIYMLLNEDKDAENL